MEWSTKSMVRLGAAVSLAALCVTAPGIARSCTLSSDYEWPSLEERVRKADYVVVGRVANVHADTELSEDPGFFEVLGAFARGRVADISVDDWLKGSGPARITVQGFGGLGECRSQIPDSRAILFLSGDAESGKLAINDIGVFDAVIGYEAATARQIRALARE